MDSPLVLIFGYLIDCLYTGSTCSTGGLSHMVAFSMAFTKGMMLDRPFLVSRKSTYCRLEASRTETIAQSTGCSLLYSALMLFFSRVKVGDRLVPGARSLSVRSFRRSQVIAFSIRYREVTTRLLFLLPHLSHRLARCTKDLSTAATAYLELYSYIITL